MLLKKINQNYIKNQKIEKIVEVPRAAVECLVLPFESS